MEKIEKKNFENFEIFSKTKSQIEKVDQVENFEKNFFFFFDSKNFLGVKHPKKWCFLQFQSDLSYRKKVIFGKTE